MIAESKSCIQAHISFTANDRLSRKLRGFVTTEDTCSMVNCIVKSVVDPSWVVRPSNTVVKETSFFFVNWPCGYDQRC